MTRAMRPSEWWKIISRVSELIELIVAGEMPETTE